MDMVVKISYCLVTFIDNRVAFREVRLRVLSI